MEADYHLIAESAEDSIFIVDRDLNITYINAYGATMLGGSPEMIIGQNLEALFTPQAAKGQKETINKIINSGKPLCVEDNYSFKSRGLWLSTRLIPIHDNKGNIVAILGISRDISELKKKEAALEENQVELERRLQHNVALNRLGGALMTTNDADKLIFMMTEGAGRALEVDVAQVYRIDIDAHLIEKLAEWKNPELSGVESAKPTCKIDEFQRGVIELWENRKPLISYDDKINPALAAGGLPESLHRDCNIKSLLIYPFDFREGRFSVLTLSRLGERRDWSDEELQMTESLTNQLTVALMKAEFLKNQEEVERALRDNVGRLEKMLEGTIDALGVTTEQKDPLTAGHQHRVVGLAIAIATEMGLKEEQIEGISIAAKVHDIGKIYIPAEILSKPTKLNELEFGIVQTHSQYGFDILKTVDFPWPIATIVLQHHERLDGSGYPLGTKGDDICIEARVLAVADSVESMLSHRPYRATLKVDEMIKELQDGRGKHYDAAVVDSCVRLFESKKFKFD